MVKKTVCIGNGRNFNEFDDSFNTYNRVAVTNITCAGGLWFKSTENTTYIDLTYDGGSVQRVGLVFDLASMSLYYVAMSLSNALNATGHIWTVKWDFYGGFMKLKVTGISCHILPSPIVRTFLGIEEVTLVDGVEYSGKQSCPVIPLMIGGESTYQVQSSLTSGNIVSLAEYIPGTIYSGREDNQMQPCFAYSMKVYALCGHDFAEIPFEDLFPVKVTLITNN